MKKLIYILFIILISSCISNNADNYKKPTEVTFQEAGTWFAEEFNTDECQIPCFINITPGETTMDQALLIVRNREDIKGSPRIYYEDDQEKKMREISWFFDDGSSCFLTTLGLGKEVYAIWITPSEAVHISLGEFFEMIGEPDEMYFQATERVSLKDVFILNSLKNYGVSFLLEMKNEILLIQEKIRIEVIFLGTGKKDSFSENFRYEFSQKWIGFGEYKDIP